MKNRIVPRVGAPGYRKLTYESSNPCDLNLLAKRKINGFSGPEDFAAIKETKKLELQAPPNLREFRATAAEMILKSLNIKTTEDGEILIWDSGVYRDGGRRKIEALCQKLADNQQMVISNGAVSEIIGIVKRRTSCDFNDFDTDPMQMSVRNGIIDLDSMTLRPHDPEFLTRIQIPWDFDPRATCPNIERSVADIVGEENLPLISEFFGHFLVKDYRFKRFPVFVGPKDSGKTVLLQLMALFLGEENVSSVAMQNLSERFMKAELDGKLANVSDDLPKGRVRDSSMIKRLSGRSRIEAEKKGKDPFSYTNFAKLIFSSNYMPRVDDPTDADFGRFMIIELRSKFGDPSREEGVKAKEPTILDKLVTHWEMSGLINMSLEGLKRLQARNWEFSYKLQEDEVAALMLENARTCRAGYSVESRQVEAEVGCASCQWEGRQRCIRKEGSRNARFATCPAFGCPVLRGWR